MVPKCTRLFFYSLLIGVGAGKFLGVRRVSAQICPNLPGKSSKEIDLQKKTIALFSNQCTSSTIFPQILPKLARKKEN